MIERENLNEFRKWAGFVGVMTIIFGAISALGGIFFYVIGAIPGILMIILGVKLRKASNVTSDLIASGGENAAGINTLFTNLNSYFKLQGILLIISLVLTALGLLFGAFAGIALMHSL